MKDNVVIKGSDWIDSDLPTLFGDEEIHFSEAADVQSLMVELNIYKSKSESMRAGRQGPIPEGWTEFKASKKRRLFIWNPKD